MEESAAVLEKFLIELVFAAPEEMAWGTVASRHPELDRTQCERFRQALLRQVEVRLNGQFGGTLGLVEELVGISPSRTAEMFLRSPSYSKYREDVLRHVDEAGLTFEHKFLEFLLENFSTHSQFMAEVEKIYIAELRLGLSDPR